MMSYRIMLCLLLCIGAVIAQHRCGPNEEWTECTGCELRCGQSVNTPCALNCRPPSCECSPIRGMRRTKGNQCVPVSQCPPFKHRAKRDVKTKSEKDQCGPNEQWRECAVCEARCTETELICAPVCKPGCECHAPDGYVRDSSGNCVKREDCPK